MKGDFIDTIVLASCGGIYTVDILWKDIFYPVFILHAVLALTVKIRKSQDFLAPTSRSPGDQIFSLTFRNSTSIFLNSHLWSKTAIVKLNNTYSHSKFLL